MLSLFDSDPNVDDWLMRKDVDRMAEICRRRDDMIVIKEKDDDGTEQVFVKLNMPNSKQYHELTVFYAKYQSGSWFKVQKDLRFMP